jgi:hypothetical protein
METATATATKELYVCSVCQTHEFSKVNEEITEEYTAEITCDTGHKHNHDSNTGTVELTCINGHTTKQEFIAKCWCGWNSVNEYATSTCTFSRISLCVENDEW